MLFVIRISSAVFFVDRAGEFIEVIGALFSHLELILLAIRARFVFFSEFKEVGST